MHVIKNIIKKRKYINIIFVVIWMAFIFIMSSFNSTESSSQSNFIVNIIVDIFNINNIELLSLIIRKLAHFTEYFILGLLTYNMINSYNKKSYIAIFICILYAISDEIHQSFVPGRSCQILDMTIDSLGGVTGIYLLQYINKYLKKIKK